MTDVLEELQAQFDALTTEEILPPMLPPDVIVSEANELLDKLDEDASLREPLEDLGIDDAWLKTARKAAHAADLAQERWVKASANRAISEWTELEHQAEHCRAEMIAAVRYHFRRDRHMLEELHEIHEGEGAADLILDLDTLARFVHNRRKVFRHDPQFDAEERSQQARELARELRHMMYDLPDERERDRVRGLRNRAFSLLRKHIFEIRAAGQYRFWQDEERSKIFLSKWRGEHVTI